MTVASLVGPVATATGVLMSLSPLLQAWRVHRLGDSSEVSAGVYRVMLVNTVVWLTYGAVTSNPVIVVPNVVALLTTTVTLLAIRRTRPRESPAPRPALAESTAPRPALADSTAH